jgi:hypothetical protein
MIKKKKWFLGGLLMIALVIQCFGPRRTNPTVVESHTIQSQLQISPRIAGILNRACMDCHSDETHWPWYSRIAPVSWWLITNVNDGRGILNFSEWAQYKPSYAIATVGSMATVVRRNAMPLASYQKFHSEARLSDEERKLFCDWALDEKYNLRNALFKVKSETTKPAVQ